MYKIGAFASLCQISAQTLRYYERLGLLEPEYTDPFTNYRYYTVRQVEQVNRIVALKELGLSLEEIGDLMHDNITTAQIEMMLKLKRTEIQHGIEVQIERVRHIDFHLRLLEQENKMIDLDMTVKPIEATRILSYKATWADDASARQFFEEASAAVRKADVPLVHDYVMVFNEHEYERYLEDLEIAFVVADDYDGEVKVGDAVFTVRTVPAVEQALTVMHKGAYGGDKGMPETMRLAFMWMAQNDYEPVPPARISYLALSPAVAEADQLRQIQIPIKKLDS
ncbi:MAG: MerR family transcriptional regulator [Chloroflexota bacterium]